MSVVATKVTDTEIVIAADSYIGLDSYGTQDKRPEAKIHQADNGVTFGACGWTEEIGLMRLFLKSHNPKSGTEDAVLEFMSEFHDWIRGKTGNTSFALRNDWHIVYGGAAFEISNGYDIFQIKKHSAIGIGHIVARTAMELGKTADEAVDMATELSSYCEKPVNIFRIPLSQGGK